jgi:hypothetical protein
MSEKNVQIPHQCAGLLNVGDWDALLELCDPAVELRDLRHPPNMPEVGHGRRAIRLVATRRSVPYDEFEAEVFEYIDADPWVRSVCQGERQCSRSTGASVSLVN